jgi:hypothetical protein
VEFARYTTTAARQWKVIVYDASHPGGPVATGQAFTLPRGSYFWPFPVHQAYRGLRAVCIGGGDLQRNRNARYAGSGVSGCSPGRGR